ncbi:MULTISPECIES: Cof-type HAD-IIB family hydrolase [Bacillota]|uniref:HAD family hydrolase n=2 Tax=Amedibacillus TaxID=2749846 RepID=A0A7G9GP10_9FIRM|nr:MULTISPECIES: Cof-type HAD-IIB family hydrolase [Bacillota]QNM12542.1 HAD family hydrolase [[Eubacterium] hominis]MCH4284149.1 Cof-type HAD-IIB family hydrolase [Amedibacillus hominis]RGB57596.1 HAD family hydrolase [Absiella sp. AM22-9]RGB62298.1 HAD family hydrolase [Absiella sp. AM10-20]RGB67700.1 HAD family hydrolase [Absiella sp. AM09-45]
MSIKMIVTDLDGTFYHRDLTYDKARFMRLYEKMKQQGIHFVVASGNQYYQLISFFDEIKDELTFVSENGAYIVDQGKELFSTEIKKDTFNNILDVLDHYPSLLTIVCGKESAYTLKNIKDEEYAFYINYFPRLKKEDSLHEIDDQILKFALVANEDFEHVLSQLKQAVDDHISVVSSGHEDIDLIVKGIHKGNAVQMLMKQWHIKPEEVMAFGDAGNDEEMLRIAKYGYVMENGSPDLLAKFHRHAPHHESDGVLEIIEQYFNDPASIL